MPELERILDKIHPDSESNDPENKYVIDSNFRIWLTCMPSEKFPPSILMRGLKMTFEPPKGLKNHLLRNFSTQTNRTFEDCQKPD